MRLSDIQKKEIIDITTGKRLGMIIDVIIDTNGKVKELILQEQRLRKLRNSDEFTVSFEEIIKFGDDIILIDPRNKHK